MSKETSYRAYDLMTSEEVGRYPTEIAGYDANVGRPVVVRYMPGRKKVKK
jgi:hypothetical protein